MTLAIILIGFACVFAAMIAAATFVKWKEVQAAKEWLPMPGKIIVSRAEAREVSAPVAGYESKGSTETRNFAVITFQYKVGGRTFTSSRHSLRHDVGNADVTETIARYPKGRAVTVYYDPADPTQAVLELVMPDGSLRFMARLSIGLVIGVIALILVVGGAMGVIRPHLPRPQNLGAAMLTGLMALFAVRMGFVQRSLAERASRWPVAKGVIDTSELQAFHIRDTVSAGWYRPWRRVFKSRVIYRYVVSGHIYVADRVAFGAMTFASLPSLVSSQARQYAQGSEVGVYYDSSNPGNAVLECRVRGLWLLWAAAIALCAATGALIGL